jgi:hypothetical protein
METRFVAIYRWRIAPEKEQQFREAWHGNDRRYLRASRIARLAAASRCERMLRCDRTLAVA